MKIQIKNEHINSALLIRAAKRVVLIAAIAVISLSASAQKSSLAAALAKHGIDPAVLDPQNSRVPVDQAFEVKQTTTTAGKTDIVLAKFDPSAAQGENWILISKNGKTPSKGDVSSFRKDKVKDHSPSRAEENSYKIEKEGSGKLEFSYKIDPSGLPKESAFLKDCRIYITIDLGTKRLETSKIVNEKPVKIAILTAEKFTVNSKFIADAHGKRYFPLVEQVNMDAKYMGQAVSVQTVTEYSNYIQK